MANPSKGSFSSKEKRQMARALGLMSQIAFTTITCVGLGFFLGHVIDNWLNTSPIFLIVFSLLGIVSAIKAMVDLSKKFTK